MGKSISSFRFLSSFSKYMDPLLILYFILCSVPILVNIISEILEPTDKNLSAVDKEALVLN